MSVSQFTYSTSYRMYEVFPDGKHFAIIRNVSTQGPATTPVAMPPQIKVVVNWFEELKKLAPPAN